MILIMLTLLISPVLLSESEENKIQIEEIYYNQGPGCDYLVLKNHGKATFLDGWTLSNGYGELILDGIYFAKGETLTISENKHDFYDVWHEGPDLTWEEELEIDGRFYLAASRGKLLLKEDGELRDSVYYGEVETGDEWAGEPKELCWSGEYAKRRSYGYSAEDWSWERRWFVGQTNLSAPEFGLEGDMSVFTSPDTSMKVLDDFIHNAENRLLVSTYHLDGYHIAERLSNISKQGVEVKVMIDGSPVGGISTHTRASLYEIHRGGGTILTVGGGEYSPYRHLHGKYMLADNSSVLISSENFGENGFPKDNTRGNRGWGVVIHDENVSNYYRNIFFEDLKHAHKLVPEPVEEITSEIPSHIGSYRPKFQQLHVESRGKITPILSPDTSMSRDTLFGMFDEAEDHIYVQQFYIDPWSHGDNPYVESLIEAAERGVTVRILLDAKWYNIDNATGYNHIIVDELNTRAKEKNLPLEARLSSRVHGLNSLHNKGAVVDGKSTLISSINWNSNSVLQNREVGLILENEKAADFFEDVFTQDWYETRSGPIADAGRSREVAINELVSFDGTSSWHKSNITTYRWDLNGDGRFDKEGCVVDWAYRETGEYTVVLQVIDEEGRVDVDSTTVQVNQKPHAYEIDEDELVWIIWAGVILLMIFFMYLSYTVSKN